MKLLKSGFLAWLRNDKKNNYEKTSFIVLNKGIFSLILVLFFFNIFFTVSGFSAEERAVDKTPVPALSVPVGTKPQTNAAIASLPKETTQIIVNFIINTQSKGDFFAELDDKQNLYLTVEDAKTLKLQYAEDKIVVIRQDEQFVPLSALLDVTYTFDENKLTVTIIGKTTESGKTAADLFSLRAAAKNIYYPRETSAFINYGLNYAYGSIGGFQSFNVSNKVGFKTGDVFFTSDSLYTKTETDDKFVRLQSSATYERRGDLQWLVMGDQYANSGDLGSTLNMGGIGFSKVYRLDPYFITQPVMDLTGSVIFPTEAEIYLNGVLIGKEKISPGSFELKNLYSYTGSHNIEVLLKDPFGNVQKISYLAYFSSQMLRKGLHEYSYNVGFLREQYGAKSNEYSNAVFSAFHRYGITNKLNVGVRAEGTEGIYNAGISTSFAIPRLGFLNLSIAGSSTEGNVLGGAVSLQHSLQMGSFNTNILLRGFSRDYATASSLPTQDSKKYELNAGMGFLLNPIGSFSINYAESETFKGIDMRAISLNYSRTLYKSISLFATGSSTHTTGDDTNYSCFVGLNFSLGENISGSAQASGGSGDVNTETLQIQKDIPVGEGLGYRASINRSETPANTTTAFNPYVQYNARYGIYSANAVILDSANGGTTESYNLSAAGSLVYAGGFFGVSRPVSDSFGIVAFNKRVPGAAVLNNGQEIGKTGYFSTMVVPTMASYGQNKITLDTKNIPMDYSISDVNKSISPSLWSGCCVYFDAQQVRALTGSLFIEKEGKKTPLEYIEISMKVGEKSVTFPTGKGGEFYVENSLSEEQTAAEDTTEDKQSCRTIAQIIKSGGGTILPGTYKAAAESDEGRCEFSLIFPETEEAITEVGEILCVSPQTPALPMPVPSSNVLRKFSPEQPNELLIPKNMLNGNNDRFPISQPAPKKKSAKRVFIFSCPDAD
jgi:outer membrane usher protein FimD/PapC